MGNSDKYNRGIGDVTFSLDQPAYYPGQTVHGRAHVRVYEPFCGQPLVLSFSGEEQVKWPAQIDRPEDTTTKQQQKVDTTQKLRLFRCEQEIAPMQGYEPGAYSFPFRFLLPLNTPPSVSMKQKAAPTSQIDAHVKYKLTAKMPIHGRTRKALGAKHAVRVLGYNSAVAQPVHMSTSELVSVLQLFGRGACTLTGQLQSDVLRMGESALVTCTVDNQSKKRVRQLKTVLYQVISVKPLKGGSPWEHTRTVNMGYYPGLQAGEKCDVFVVAAMEVNGPSDIHVASVKESELLRPSHTGNLFSLSYKLRVECVYSWCPNTDVSVEFPLTLLP